MARAWLSSLVGVSLAFASSAWAGGLSDVFRKELAGLEMEPLGGALANTVASTYPVASASSSVTYSFDPATGTFERQTRILGPIIGERAETIGRGQLNISTSYSYVDLKTINGHDLDDLTNKESIDGSVVSFPVPDGITLADGRFTNFLPVLVKADIGVDAHIVTPTITYGLTPDLDLNLTLPIVRTSLDVKVRTQVPDPRLPQFALPAGSDDLSPEDISTSDDSVGIGDVLLRSKYVVHRGWPVDFAAGLGLSFPSGNEDDFQGTGNWQVQPLLILSRRFAERYEPLLNVGVNINANHVDRSVVGWAVGGSAQLFGPLTAAVLFLGRHELSEQSDEIDTPFFFQIDRNDIYDASVGFRYLFAESGVISANVIVPLNDDGLRADVIPTFEIEYAFSAPW